MTHPHHARHARSAVRWLAAQAFVFGAMFWRWRNVWPLVVAHTIANIAAFLLTPR